jgi:hypothetical protein
MLYNGHFCFCELLWELCDVLLWIWFFQFCEYLFQKGFLLSVCFLLHGCRFGVGFWLLFGVFGDALDEFLADLCDFVVVVGAVRVVGFEEGEFWFVLFSCHEDGLEFGSVDCYVLCGSF